MLHQLHTMSSSCAVCWETLPLFTVFLVCFICSAHDHTTLISIRGTRGSLYQKKTTLLQILTYAQRPLYSNIMPLSRCYSAVKSRTSFQLSGSVALELSFTVYPAYNTDYQQGVTYLLMPNCFLLILILSTNVRMCIAKLVTFELFQWEKFPKSSYVYSELCLFCWL